MTSVVMNATDRDNDPMRAGRLVSVMLILQRRGRVTAAQLAVDLEVSQRTVLRDMEALSGAGVPVFATRGPGGGFELLEGFTSDVTNPPGWHPRTQRAGAQRARVRISPEGRRLAAVLGRLQPLRIRRGVPAAADGWLEATFRVEALDATVMDVLSLGPHIEVLAPGDLRARVADQLHRAAQRYRDH
jgi:predicted DNA-binding transcriptional regulator YafY